MGKTERRAEDGGPGFIAALAGDGRPLLAFSGLCLCLAGGFALFLSASGQFLPHDVQFLGMTAERLCSLNGCRIVHFMLHDRAAFGGSILSCGILYLWLAEFPLRRGEAWAWWAFALSGLSGFGSFMAYLGYGYLDSWHLVSTLALLAPFAAGLALSARRTPGLGDWRSLTSPGVRRRPGSREWIGWICLLLTGIGLVGAGTVILSVGTTVVFVPQDLEFMRASRAELEAVSERLVPLIAHDRAGFGGGLASTGIALTLAVWKGRPARALWDALALGGFSGFGCAVGVHYVIGYTSFTHLLPAYLGTAVFLAGLALSAGEMRAGKSRRSSRECLD